MILAHLMLRLLIITDERIRPWLAPLFIPERS